ncbi:MAG: S1 family peptidase [Myxococcales bacterium]|nr:S1 family peptidase [Myxococcales bacterium]
MRNFLILILPLVVACAAVPEEASSRRSSIVNGERTNMNEDAVVAVLNRLGGLCSGTLIAPRVVLTAKHCVQNPGADGPNAPDVFVVGVGDTTRSLTRTFTVVEISTPPGRYSDRGGLSGALVGIDVATMILSQPVTGVRPVPVHRGDARAIPGNMFRAIGFGQIPSGGAGVKYRTTTTVSSVDSGVIYTPPTICQGDSGGPLMLVNEEGNDEVVGVASFGTGACGSGINGYNRVDVLMNLIDTAIMVSGECVGDGTDVEVCDGFDNDCDGEIDEDCADLGEPCADDSECRSLNCRNSVCTQGCDPLRPFTGCPPGLYCRNFEGCEGLCMPGVAGGGMVDEECEADTDCGTLACLDPGDGRRRCLDPCRGDQGTCISGDVCAAVPGACGGCVPAAIVVGSRGLGEPCDEDSDCGSGQCHVEEDFGRCTRDCAADTDCAAGYHCRATESGGICLPAERGGVGSGCVENADCANTLFCAARGGVRWCSSFCEVTDDCPPDFACTEVGPDTRICVPDRGTIGTPCADGDECISGLCEPVGARDALECTRECSGEALCPPGFECRRSDDRSRALCERTALPPPESSGGCATSPGGRGGFGALLLLVALGMALRPRRSPETRRGAVR